jgi:hypothetical protein
MLLNLLRAVPEGALDARAVEGSKTVAEMFLHIHGTRQFVLSEASSRQSALLQLSERECIRKECWR